jgi:hypothetical protein
MAVTRSAVGATLLFILLFTGILPASARVLHAPAGGAVRALVIGIDKYANMGKGTELSGAVADARDIAAALRATGVPNANVQLLIDGAAVRSRVIAEMDRLVRESKAGDLVIIAYSGHGMRVRGYPRWDGLLKTAYHSQIAMSDYSPTLQHGHNIIVDGEMRAWYSRLDAKGVDVLVVMDTCHGGHMRGTDLRAPEIRLRQTSASSGDKSLDDRIHDTFKPIEITEWEARSADTDEMPHVTFLAGATEDAVVPEMAGIDPANPGAVRGALSYFVARAIDGKAEQRGGSPAGNVTRKQIWKFLKPNVEAATGQRQFIDFGPHNEELMQQAVFGVDDETSGGGKPEAPVVPATGLQQVAPVRLAMTNGTVALSAIRKGQAPFELSEPATADVIWDVGTGGALSRGDPVTDKKVDASLIGAIIDRTFAVREIQKMAVPRIIDVTIGEKGQTYALGKRPKLVVTGIQGSYLTVVNVAGDGTVQVLFPNPDPGVFRPDQFMRVDTRIDDLEVVPPLGAEYTVVIATAGPPGDLVTRLTALNNKHDAFKLVAVLADQIKADSRTRLGTAGLFTR